MGIRFLCPNGHKLNVKADLAGKRGSCPDCGAKLVIPAARGGENATSILESVGEPPAPVASWYLRSPDGEPSGPVSEQQFSDWISAGQVTASSHIWREGWAEWKLARDAADTLPVPLVALPILPVATDPVEQSPPVAAAAPVAPSPASESSDPTPPPALMVDWAEKLEADPVDVAPAALHAAKYVSGRQRSKQKQVTLAVVMLVAVILLAGVLVWVVSNNESSTSSASHAGSAVSSRASALRS